MLFWTLAQNIVPNNSCCPLVAVAVVLSSSSLLSQSRRLRYQRLRHRWHEPRNGPGREMISHCLLSLCRAQLNVYHLYRLYRLYQYLWLRCAFLLCLHLVPHLISSALISARSYALSSALRSPGTPISQLAGSQVSHEQF